MSPIDACSIADIWRALGGGELRRGRGRAFWRNGDGYSVDIDSARGVWYDFVHGEGGGKLALVQKVLGCSRGEANQWLADLAGIALVPELARTPQQRRAYALARQEAAEDAQLAIWWLESAREKLEFQKRLNDGFGGPWNRDLFEAASSALHCLSRLDAAGISEAWEKARLADPAQTTALEAAGREWQARFQEVVTRIIQPWGMPNESH